MCQIMSTKHFSFSLLFSLCFVCLTNLIGANPKICKQCHHNQSEENPLIHYCRNENRTGILQLDQSCCVNKTNPSEEMQIVGLDMSDCGLKSIKGMFNDLQNLRVLMLENNTDMKIQPEDFNGLLKLEYLSLPDNIQCPGGNKSWHSIENHNTTTICLEEINLCVQNNVTCQNNNSHCVLIGPGEMECLCLPGYHGYKCLRQGTFPALSFTIALCACTVGISGFLWCTQRRKVKRKSHRH